jgi:predicted Zn-dependent protease
MLKKGDKTSRPRETPPGSGGAESAGSGFSATYEQGRMLLEDGRLADVIRVLERALGRNPSNGQNYYYLSEAWLMKGNTKQAAEFNRLASIYLKGDSNWMPRVVEQKERIERHTK